ncbi:MAG: methyltransferase domain-containing protein [Acidobacteria bacterium]|nr:MAG: methyltransferase domain-containing protein [Acidobacteriota bacterium]
MSLKNLPEANEVLQWRVRMRYLSLLQCPHCQGRLEKGEAGISCLGCNQIFPVVEGLPQLYWPEDSQENGTPVTSRVRAFYETNPFPNYDDFDDLASLVDKARQGIFARLLDEQIPFKTRVLDCGCGTGQLTNFLGIAQRSVFGTDMCLNSLKLAESFRKTHELDLVHFLQMNIFRPVFRPAIFDVVVCNGVLHHTADPERGLAVLTTLLKPGGYLVVGLYHRFGRIWTDLRRVAFRVLGEGAAWLDPRIRQAGLTKDRRKAWFADQYQNPHESKHTVGEVLQWLNRHGLSFVKSLPKTRLGAKFENNERLFEPEPPGNSIERAIVETGQLFGQAAENGFFVVIARKQ